MTVTHRPPLLWTDCLRGVQHPEMEVLLRSEEFAGLAEALLRQLVGYILDCGVRLEVGETLQHGSWLLQVQEGAEGRRRIGAMRDDSGAFRESIDQALIIDDAQRRQCAIFGVEFTPPAPHQLVVVDDGVPNGHAVQGVRYPGPDHMSGWWITTAGADEGTENLRTVHVTHVITTRPDLMQLLALPTGWRFDTAQGHSAWFDEAVEQDLG